MVEGWTCLNLPTQCARPIGEIIVKETGRPVRYYGDKFHLMTEPVLPFRHEAVRLLMVDDTPLERWRNQGLSTAATSLVAQQVHHERQIPGMEL